MNLPGEFCSGSTGRVSTESAGNQLVFDTCEQLYLVGFFRLLSVKKSALGKRLRSIYTLLPCLHARCQMFKTAALFQALAFAGGRKTPTTMAWSRS